MWISPTLDDFLILNILHLSGSNMTGTSTNHLCMSEIIALTHATGRQAKVGHFFVATETNCFSGPLPFYSTPLVC